MHLIYVKYLNPCYFNPSFIIMTVKLFVSRKFVGTTADYDSYKQLNGLKLEISSRAKKLRQH